MSASDPLPLSLAIIAHNEAANIRRCLESAAPLAREIVVLLNDSTDDTEAIAKEFGATIYHETWHGHRDQKNLCLEKATQPWVLAIDADEAVSPELAQSIRGFIEADGSGHNGAFFARKVWYLGRWITHGDWYPDWSLRLIRQGKGKWTGSREHDKMDVDGSVQKLPGDLLHFSFRDMDHQLSKIPYFADIYLDRMLDRGETWNAPSVIFRSIWRFFRAYFIRLGFLDGYPGFYIAWFQAFSTCYRHTKLYEHNMKERCPEDPR